MLGVPLAPDDLGDSDAVRPHTLLEPYEVVAPRWVECQMVEPLRPLRPPAFFGLEASGAPRFAGAAVSEAAERRSSKASSEGFAQARGVC